jgi:hypothetical protein
MRSFTPEVYVVVSLKPTSRIPLARAGRDSALVRDAEQVAFETLTTSCRPARDHAGDPVAAAPRRRARSREPDVDPHWHPPALSLDGGVWDSGRADVQHFMAAVTERSRTLRSRARTASPSRRCSRWAAAPDTEYPGNAELLFAPLESLDFPVDAVAHVKWIANKTMQTKADNAVKDARNAIEDAAPRSSTRRPRGASTRPATSRTTTRPSPTRRAWTSASRSPSAPADEENSSARQAPAPRLRLRAPLPAPRAAGRLYADHLLRPDGATVRDYRRLLTREQLAAMMPIGSHQAGADRGIYIATRSPAPRAR